MPTVKSNPPRPPAPRVGPAPKLKASRFQDAQFMRNVWAVTPEHGHTLSDLLAQEYWAHVVHVLKPYDRIEVYSEDNTFYAELLVLMTYRGGAKVVSLYEHVMEPVVADPDQEFTVKFKGPHHRYCVVRTKDNETILHGFPDQQEAQKALADHVRAVAA